MAISEQDLVAAEARFTATREAGTVTAARYDHTADRIIITLNTGVEIACPRHLIEGLSEASASALAEIEISPAGLGLGLGLHWPQLDADVYVPALLQGTFGSRRWMASQLGATGGHARSAAKAAAARANGRKGGRPRKTIADAS